MQQQQQQAASSPYAPPPNSPQQPQFQVQQPRYAPTQTYQPNAYTLHQPQQLIPHYQHTQQSSYAQPQSQISHLQGQSVLRSTNSNVSNVSTPNAGNMGFAASNQYSNIITTPLGNNKQTTTTYAPQAGPSMQPQPQPPSSTTAPAPPPQFSHGTIETILQLNQHLIKILLEYQKNSWTDDPEYKAYQTRLQTNLTYLATVADWVLKAGSNPSVKASVPPSVPSLSPVIYPLRLQQLGVTAETLKISPIAAPTVTSESHSTAQQATQQPHLQPQQPLTPRSQQPTPPMPPTPSMTHRVPSTASIHSVPGQQLLRSFDASIDMASGVGAHTNSSLAQANISSFRVAGQK